MEVPPVLKVSRAEERGPETSVCEYPLRDRLRYRGLSRSSEPIQPVDRGLIKIAGPKFDLVQNSAASPLETAGTVAMSILGLSGITEIIEDNRFGCHGDRLRGQSSKAQNRRMF